MKKVKIISIKNSDLTPEEEQEFDKIIEETEKQIANVNFRWSKSEIDRAKRIASKKGMPYQTYLKSTLKQQMDKDEKELHVVS